MNWTQQWIWELDGWIVLTGVLCAIAAALPGNYLVLRRLSMLGDAISHAILPGLAVAFLISHSRSSVPMFVGAAIVGVLTAVFTEWIRSFGEVDEGASMGVVFTTLFALGLVMIVQTADNVDLDPGCVLYGAIELTPLDMVTVAGMELPRAVIVLSCVVLINLVFLTVFHKELQLCAFDSALASASGFNPRLMYYLLMIVVAVTAVACFESVGNILVVAMLIVPPAAARLLTDRLPLMIALSAVIAASSAVIGHAAAITLPGWFGFGSASTAGMMALATGILFVLAGLFAPQQGVVVRVLRQRLLSLRILSEDLIALLYRMEERQCKPQPAISDLCNILLAGKTMSSLLMWDHRRRGLVNEHDGRYSLTPAGQRLGTELVRSHRLWEQYLVSEAGVALDRIHDQAEQLEHFTGRDLRDRLDQETAAPRIDPHGTPIPSENVRS